jgi:hypothetical protein
LVRKKIDNAERGWRAKVEIRERVLAALTPARTVVFDAFAGTGRMWSAVWKQAAGYVACDERWHDDERCCYVADNRRVLRCIDLAPFTCFDLDAYDSPWEQAIILAVRRPRLRARERLGLVLTEGTWLTTMTGKFAVALRQASGLTGQHATEVRTIYGVSTALHDDLIARALGRVARQMGGRIVRHWRAEGQTSARLRYLGVVIEGSG